MADKVYIENYLPEKDALLTEAMQHPTLKPKRKPTSELAHKAVLIVVEREVRAAIATEIEDKLQEAYDMYEMTGTSRAAAVETLDQSILDDWESGLDDAIEDMLEPYQSYLSADWLGKNTIDVRLWEENAIPTYAAEVGKEVYKQLTYGKTPAQALANAGITSPEVELYFAQHLEQNSEDDTPMTVENNADLASVIAKIAEYVGKTYDPVAVYQAFEDAIDDDDILADGAGKRLGLEHNDVIVLQLFPMEAQSDDAAEELTTMVTEAVAKLGQGKPKGAKHKAQPKPENAPTGDVLDARVLALIAEHSAAKDTEFAKEIGISRGSLGNYRKGDSAFAPTDDQRAAIRQQIVADVNGLLEALSLVDGGQAMAVS